ncbi:hypothetical protein TBK1r_09370 [Stieleria magnilauensis]|uniref:Glycosyl hydrolases family 2, sugar binding domain n=2 Tax=Stieleria magnilauensis TaxID=2527963 RepID=A0ABX5XJ52_9BACT|nr:hypothetical protein TBK1r_09370 [Planctomycetes bacterium TBK1r]
MNMTRTFCLFPSHPGCRLRSRWFASRAGVRPLVGIALAMMWFIPAAFSAQPDLEQSLQAIAKTDGSVALDQDASAAAHQLQSLPSSQVTDVLEGFDNASKRGKNWLRAIAADVSDNGPFPKDALLGFFADRSKNADARYVAYQLLTQHDQGLTSELLADAETDPSLPIRYLKIESLIQAGAELMSTQPDQAKQVFRQVIAHGRSPKQLEKTAKLLADLDVNIDLAEELGMMRRWWLIGPFDNTDSEHFDTAYVPENRYLESGSPIARDAAGEPKPETGKKRTVTWQQIESDDNLGMVDLNGPLSNEKDAAAYLFATFTVDGEATPMPAQIRIGCITANKVWINGKLVSSNEVYHSGTRIDQYVEDCELVDGENTVMIKVMQNAQTEPWAQDWQFQFRLTRPDGSAIKTNVL